MSSTGFLATLGVVMVAQELLHYLPQPLKIHRRKTIAGVSPSATLLTAIMSFVWFSFAVWERAWAPAAAGVVVVSLSWWAVAEVLRFGANKRRLLRVGSVAVILVAAVTVVSVSLGQQALGLGVLLLAATAAHGSMRLTVGMTAKSLAGISATYLLLNVTDGFLYGIYGAATGNHIYMIFAALQTITSAPVLARWLLKERHTKRKEESVFLAPS